MLVCVWSVDCSDFRPSHVESVVIDCCDDDDNGGSGGGRRKYHALTIHIFPIS